MLQRTFNRNFDRIASKTLSRGALAAMVQRRHRGLHHEHGRVPRRRRSQAQAKDAIPALASIKFAWIAVGADWRDPPAGSGHGPMKRDPAHPFHGNLDGPGQVTIRLGNTDDPVLKPWAAAQMRASNEEAITGKRAVPFTAQGRCYPGSIQWSGTIGRAVLFHPDPPRRCG